MTHYLIDTTPLAGLVNSRAPVVDLVRPWMLVHAAATSVLVYGEVLEGLKGRSNYARRHSELRPPHGAGLIGDIDTLIAATALEYERTLVTADADFARVPGLQLILLHRLTLLPLPGYPSS